MGRYCIRYFQFRTQQVQIWQLSDMEPFQKHSIHHLLDLAAAELNTIFFQSLVSSAKAAGVTSGSYGNKEIQVENNQDAFDPLLLKLLTANLSDATSWKNVVDFGQYLCLFAVKNDPTSYMVSNCRAKRATPNDGISRRHFHKT